MEEVEENKSSDFGRDSRASIESVPFTPKHPEIRVDQVDEKQNTMPETIFGRQSLKMNV